MIAIQIEHAPQQLRRFVEVALAGEEIVITRLGEPIIKWVIVATPENTTVPKPRRQPGSAKHLNIRMSDDFNAPLADFEEYMS